MSNALATADTSTYPEDVQEVALAAVGFPDEARAIRITGPTSYDAAGALLGRIKRQQKVIADGFLESVGLAKAAHTAAVALRTRAYAPGNEAEGIIKPRIAAWEDKQRAVREAAEREAADERREAERLAAEDTQRRQREADAAAEQQRLADVEAATKAGDAERAAEILSAPTTSVPVAPAAAPPPPPVRVPAAPKTAGVSTRRIWKWRLKDSAAVGRTYLMVDEKKVGAIVRSLGPDAAGTVGGIEVYPDTVVAGRG